MFGLVWLQRNRKNITRINLLNYTVWRLELHLSLRKYNLPALHWCHSKEWLTGNFSWQNHNISRQKHDEGEPNGWNQLWVANNFINWLTYKYFVVISKEMIFYLSDAFTQIPCYWVLSCWAAKKQKEKMRQKNGDLTWMGYHVCLKFCSPSKLFVMHYQATTDETKYNDNQNYL